MNIDYLAPSDDKNIIVKFVLENGSEGELYWDALKKYMIITGFFKEKYLVSRNEEDVLEFPQYWEEIDISYQEQFVIIGLYTNERKDGTIVIWDVEEEKFSYILSGNDSYGVLILKSYDLLLLLHHIGRNTTKVTVNRISIRDFKPKNLASTFKPIKHFEPEDYNISAAGLIVSVDRELINEYGELGLFYSSENEEVYCHIEGKLYTYKIEYILERLND